ncbi:MAG: GspE/PulE family protein [Burkholderiales bacterium]|jgi:general secretion pathway protein E
MNLRTDAFADPPAADPPLDRTALTARMAAFMQSHLDAAWTRQCLLFKHADHAELVTAHAPDEALLAWADGVASVPVVARRADASDVRDLLLALRQAPGSAVAPMAAELANDARMLEVSAGTATAGDAAARLNEILLQALRSSASDVHFEAMPGGAQLRLRIDGVLEPAGNLDNEALARRMVSRIKVLAELDIAEQRIPQDGRLAIAAEGRRIDLRVSVMPSVHGEDVVLRILDKQRLAGEAGSLRLDALGFDTAAVGFIRTMSRRPHGLLLVTGPTGSGKTTTLYAALAEINRGLDKIITIEDPVEYQLPGVLQIPVNEAKGLTFARGLRSILRHDPDRIMVGEIRDEETAQIAVQAALTGHSVFSSVHANDVYAVLGRFLQLGVDAHNFVSALNGIVAQRLLRGVCPNCAAPVAVPSRLMGEAEQLAGSPQNCAPQAGRGCAECRGTGHAGRHAVAQTLEVDDELRETISARGSPTQLKQMARARGTRSLREAALALALAGRTSFDEVERVTDG